MFYYLVAFSGRNLAPLTYRSQRKFEIFSAVSAPLQGKILGGFIVGECEAPTFKTLEILAPAPYLLTPLQIELSKFIAHYYTCEIGVALALFEPQKIERNLSESQSEIPTASFKIPNLSAEQKAALDFVRERKTSLIFGDTGSGKSEIYIAAIAEILKRGEQALFLMPEISLTPQMQKRLEGFFGSAVAVWHSKISPKKKEQILSGIADGQIRLIAGARSALFLPLPRLRLIIVDEEHDDSYKNTGSRPHYNARDLALFAASKSSVRVVLGSATPSVTSFAKQPHFRLKGTFFKGSKTFIFDESETGVSQTLKNELARCLAAKKQAVICLPTRANFKYLECKECGHTIKCPFCSVGMSFYKRANALKCQYCDYRTTVPSACEKCGSEMIEARRIGTSELIERLQSEFAGARIAKFDRDEITTQNKLEKALKAFNAGEIDVLVGTQMLSKGHDYHGVALAVVTGLDELLNFPDFRARERTLALAMQVAGRTGRAGEGRVLIQSRRREFFERYINDYDAFLLDETSFREGLYPPFTRLLRVVVSHKNEDAARDLTYKLVERLEILRAKIEDKAPLEIVGYGKCGIEMIGAKFRYEILLRCASHAPLIKAARICASHGFDVDMDPINFS